MKATSNCLTDLMVITLSGLLHLAAGQEAMTLTAGGYGPSSSSSGPRIMWTPPAVNAPGNFTLIGAASSDSAMKYVSFAFSNGTNMEHSFTVVDCYEISGVVTVGTSRNFADANETMNNVNDPASLSRLQLLSANKSAGVLTCSFSMNFAPTLEVNVMIAFGAMKPGANASSPTKDYHGQSSRFVSASTIREVLAATAMSTTIQGSLTTSMQWSCVLLAIVIGAQRTQLL